MPTFGFSAFLKLVLMSERPQRSSITGRFRKRDNGYDFHRSLRLRIRRMLALDEPVDSVIASVAEILRAPEQKSVRLGLEQLIDWREVYPGKTFEIEAVIYESPNKIFKVKFTPDFGVQIGHSLVAVHAWNTKTPKLESRSVFGALSLFRELYREKSELPDDLAVLSLRDGKFYRLSENPSFAALGLRLIDQLEETFRSVEKELGIPPRRDDRPSLPPPPPS